MSLPPHSFVYVNSDLSNTSIIYTLLVGMAYTLTGTLSLLFSPSGTKALMRQFVADAPKAHESLSTEARRVPVQGTPIPLISVFIAIFRLDTICRFCELTGTEQQMIVP